MDVDLLEIELPAPTVCLYGSPLEPCWGAVVSVESGSGSIHYCCGGHIDIPVGGVYHAQKKFQRASPSTPVEEPLKDLWGTDIPSEIIVPELLADQVRAVTEILKPPVVLPVEVIVESRTFPTRILVADDMEVPEKCLEYV